MKNKIVFFLMLFLTINIHSQISFEKGYFINNSNEKVDCFIKNMDWNFNPLSFDYKLSSNSPVIKSNISDVREFKIDNASKYVRAKVQIDKSSESIGKLSRKRNPVFVEEELFLKVLVEDKAILYSYNQSGLKRFFYKIKNSSIQQLVFKSYVLYSKDLFKNENVGKNNFYKQQLWKDLKCSSISKEKIEKLDYKKKDIYNLFVLYNKCQNPNFVIQNKEQKKAKLNLTIRPRLNLSSLEVKFNTLSNSSFKSVDLESELGIGLGLELEYILPFNKNKWALLFEPNYQTYKTKNSKNTSAVSGGVLVSEVDYNSIELALGVRYYLFLNNNSKFFVNASYVLDSPSGNSKLEFLRADNSVLDVLPIKSNKNFAFGLGFKMNEKFSIEMRYLSPRESLGRVVSYRSNYNTLSLIFGYSFL